MELAGFLNQLLLREVRRYRFSHWKPLMQEFTLYGHILAECAIHDGVLDVVCAVIKTWKVWCVNDDIGCGNYLLLSKQYKIVQNDNFPIEWECISDDESLSVTSRRHTCYDDVLVITVSLLSE